MQRVEYGGPFVSILEQSRRACGVCYLRSRLQGEMRPPDDLMGPCRGMPAAGRVARRAPRRRGGSADGARSRP
jgi:hypothetical protein